LIVDEIYHGLTYETDADTVLAHSRDAWVVQSFSKYFQMTGWRLGWLVVPKPHLRDVEKLAQNLYISPPTPAQHAALAAFHPETLAILEERRQAFRQRRDFLAPELERLGLRIAAPSQGAFYLYCDSSALGADSFQLAGDILRQAHVALTPGIDFGANQPERHLRIAYTTDLSRLEEAIRRLGRYFGR
jgi:aspartate/methionine/tyrosine aminotransferase